MRGFWRKRWVVLVGAIVASGLAPVGRVEAAGLPVCRAGVNDARARPAPADMLPMLARAFNLPVEALRSSTYIRCAGGHLLACTVGANLSCGKADTRRHSAAANDFCRQNPGAAVIPLVVTGHDTIYTWRCAGQSAVAGGPVTAVDRQGFVKQNWVRIR
jgi:hypothetical protein